MKISKKIINEIYEHGKKEAPIEACGYLAGINDEVEDFYPMHNIDQSNEHFTLDPQEQFDVMKKVRAKELEILAVYHTHPESPARPSEEDIKLAFDPGIIYVILSLLEEKNNIKAFKIINGHVTEQELIIEE
jgi:proteasome lid subunit RPN8/RPN11